MEKEIENLLESSIKEVALNSIKDIDIKSIFIRQIEEVTVSIARDMFSSYGDFSKLLKNKLKKELDFSVNQIKVPQFGKLTLDTITSNLKKYEIEHIEKATKEAEETIRKILGLRKDPVSASFIEDEFLKIVFERCFDQGDIEHMEYDKDSTAEHFSDNIEMNFIDKEWGRGAWYSSHLTICLEPDKNSGIDELKIDLHLSKEKNDKGSSDKYVEYYKNNDKIPQLYSILSIKIDGEDIARNSTNAINIDGANTELAKTLLSVFVNGSTIDLTKLDYIDYDVILGY